MGVPLPCCTLRAADGDAVPIPTFPPLLMRMRSTLFWLKIIPFTSPSPRALPPRKIVPPLPAFSNPPCNVKFPPLTLEGRQVGSRHFDRIEEFEPSKMKSVFWLRT